MKSLVLDIDGTILRDGHLNAHVRRNCEGYVKLKLPESKRPAYTNRVLYQIYGHTAHGLAETFKIDTSDFNDKVYDTHLMAHLWEVLESREFQADARIIHDLSQNDWRVTLFTNSPIIWAGNVARAINDDVRIVCPSGTKGPFKPATEAYTLFEKNVDHVFVDDSLDNLKTTQWLPNWRPIWFGGEPTRGLPVVNSFSELIEVLESL